MKQTFTLAFCLLFASMQAQIIYVKQNAAGANNGSSWTNAYTSLDQALAAATSGQSVWVAAGTYKPSNPAPNTFFFVNDGTQLYGGFAGTENSVDQRNISGNLTILSGDIAGNDVPGNFSSNRSDNAQHVITVYSITTNNSSLVDGFVISHGHTLEGSANPALSRLGGGMLINAKATVRNCLFTENFGETGSALTAFDALSDEIVLENCIFENNKATQSGICYLESIPTGNIKNCIFRKNTTNRGALYPYETVDLKIDNCLFESNNAGANFGGAMFSWQASYTLTNCIFRKNKANNAAGIYMDNRDGGDIVTIDHCLFEFDTTANFGGSGLYCWQATFDLKNTTFRNNYAPNAAAIYCNGREFDSSFSIDSCTFENNTTSASGSAMYQNRTNYTMSNCVFKGNVSGSSGTIAHRDTTIFRITDCLFEKNKGNYAGAIANYGIGCDGDFVHCTFSQNQATQGGGACSNGFKANTGYLNCDFLGNQASFGGAIFTQNDTTRLRVDGCRFEANNTTGTGGAVYVNTNIAAQISNSVFSQNIGSTGGGLHVNGDSLLNLYACSFIDNIATNQGAGVNLNHAKAEMTNCLFIRNVNSGTGAGGGVSCNAGDNVINTLKAVNCTFADNIAAVGAGIAQWESELGNSQLTLLNCLLQNPDGNNYEIEEGEPEVFSLNGNQCADVTLESALILSKDKNNTFNNFVDPNNDNYHPTMGSPAVDGGVAAGAPPADIDGTPRTSIPDVGCYEFNTVGTHTPGVLALPLQCAPNPATDRTLLQFRHARNGRVSIIAWNELGRQVAYYESEKTAETFSFSIPVHEWPAGSYRVQVRLGALLHEGALIKQ